MRDLLSLTSEDLEKFDEVDLHQFRLGRLRGDDARDCNVKHLLAFKSPVRTLITGRKKKIKK